MSRKNKSSNRKTKNKREKSPPKSKRGGKHPEASKKNSSIAIYYIKCINNL